MIIHFSFPFIGGGLIAIAQYAVPFFFMVSGYFSANKEPKRILKQAGKILKLFLVAFLAAILVGILKSCCLYGYGGVKNYLLGFLKKERIISFFINNNVYANYSLWFLPSLIYVYLMYAFVRKCKINRWVYYVIGFVLLIAEFVLEGLLPLFSIEVTIYARNFLLAGLPFFAVGVFIKDFQKEILEKTSKKGLIVLCLVGIVESLGSAYFRQCTFLGSLFIAFSLIVLSLKIEIRSNAFLDVLSQCSTYVYIFHVLVYRVFVEIIFTGLGWTNFAWWSWVESIAVMTLTFVIAICIVLTQNAVSRKQWKQKKQEL